MSSLAFWSYENFRQCEILVQKLQYKKKLQSFCRAWNSVAQNLYNIHEQGELWCIVHKHFLACGASLNGQLIPFENEEPKAKDDLEDLENRLARLSLL
ncbi:hypothetical protein BpHYR1_021396 [Brachionus plicatilis]|uniref:Uncharacterized protein n=1 Tax=Brachionus plicatilis TaxID=10195 RepID=A0A3M7QB86_BRAPC|nr:hypothetical protein BpHYR1_021396 [Brachionus plicatilis]